MHVSNGHKMVLTSFKRFVPMKNSNLRMPSRLLIIPAITNSRIGFKYENNNTVKGFESNFEVIFFHILKVTTNETSTLH